MRLLLLPGFICEHDLLVAFASMAAGEEDLAAEGVVAERLFRGGY